MGRRPKYAVTERAGESATSIAKQVARARTMEKKNALKRITADFIATHEALRLGVLNTLLFSRETSPSIVEQVCQRIRINPADVTAYHGVVMRAIIDAQNGSQAAARYLRDEEAGLQSQLATYRASKTGTAPALYQYNINILNSLADDIGATEEIRQLAQEQLGVDASEVAEMTADADDGVAEAGSEADADDTDGESSND